jgi:hypothetical protein
VKRGDGQHLTYYRLSLPVSNGGAVNAQVGKWHIVMKINEQYKKRFFGAKGRNSDARGYQRLLAHGVPYAALVHAYSNLRMKCTLGQSSYEPGATLALRVALTEYGVPLQKKASVRAKVGAPDGTSSVITLTRTGIGVYEASLSANYSGVYRFLIRASGMTTRNAAYTRELYHRAGELFRAPGLLPLFALSRQRPYSRSPGALEEAGRGL